ncbi:MAG: hypothetical protein JO110_26235 [Acetobacteraceae bacterium]|nr:hypothetical protein [Acetobacteraceae bacterium]
MLALSGGEDRLRNNDGIILACVALDRELIQSCILQPWGSKPVAWIASAVKGFGSIMGVSDTRTPIYVPERHGKGDTFDPEFITRTLKFRLFWPGPSGCA